MWEYVVGCWGESGGCAVTHATPLAHPLLTIEVDALHTIPLLILSPHLSQADYTRYHGDDLARSVNVPCGPHPGRQLPSRVCSFLLHKCIPMLFDAGINGPLTGEGV